MIDEANFLNNYFKINIDFIIGDATNLIAEKDDFDVFIFSFNGLMSIPDQIIRNVALNEIDRVLKSSGYFMFTTHDRDMDATYLEFWK